MGLVWHYTTGDLLASIEADGEIEPAIAGLKHGPISEDLRAQLEEIVATGVSKKVPLPFKERPVVWFSRRPTWEPTATKGVIDGGVRRTATIAEMVERGGDLARIGVEPAGLFSWTYHVNKGGLSKKDARALERAAREVGAAPGDWLVHYGAVSRDRWKSVERSTDGTTWR
jgi:hypothetical protein